MRAPETTATRVIVAVSFVLATRPALAHIKMSAPADWLMTNSEGDPQKIAPCGVDSSTTYTATNKITTVHAGDQLTVSWTETVPHDGHFRIALALQSRDELKDPAVTATNPDGTPMSVEISDPPVYPVLADNLFPHKASEVSAGHMYTYPVTIPADASCTKCTLQLIQFMSEHPADPSFFYHHCADLSIQGPSGGTGAGGKGGGAGTAQTGGSGGVHMTGGGGVPGSGGATSSGGAPGTGGVVATGGVPGTGGLPASGGSPGSGGVSGTGGISGTGGAAGTGGSSSGDSSSSGGCSCQSAPGMAGGLGVALLGLLVALARRRRA